MTKSELFHLKNYMLGANFLANLIGVLSTKILLFKTEGPLPDEILLNPIFNFIDAAFVPAAFILVGGATLVYERPIRSYLSAKFKKMPVPLILEHNAQQKLLNEPFILIALSFSMWLLSAILYPAMYSIILDESSYWIQRSCFLSLSTGLITITVAFFLLEYVLQKRLAPHFFPNGGLYTVPKTLRIRIRTRLAALLFASNLIPLITIIVIMHRISGSQLDPAMSLNLLRSSIYVNGAIFLIAGTLLTMLVSKNLTLPFGEIIHTLRGVRNGQFDLKVRVTSNDEIGYTGDVINEMTKGLIERERMEQSLNLAKEVQQNLLPKSNLKANGLEIAGKSVYCDETGGDYYDFMSVGGNEKQKIGIAIGDVSGHGISSALLMATVRSSLRQRTSLPGNITKIISDVNRQLVEDVEDSGQFMTMFFLAIDTTTRQLEWVRAGHDPGIVYDPGSDSFSELGGSGIALGLDAEYIYEDNKKKDFSNSQIIFLSTDGIWEARNSKGEMLGKDPILNAIRRYSTSDATKIIDEIFKIVSQFIGDAKIEDDITSVIIKNTELIKKAKKN